MKILIIDDEKNICISLKNIFDDEGYISKWVNSCAESKQLLDDWDPDLIILDVMLKNENGIEYLETLRKEKVDKPVIMISGHSGIKEAVRAMKAGAFDFLEKPLNLPKVKLTVRNAIEFYLLKNNYSMLKNDFEKHYEIIGNSPKLHKTLELVKKLAKTNSKVLIRGESGTGKELIAFALHNMSSRRHMPFIKFNSAAIPLELIESELFGHEKGAFTGAEKSKKGKIEIADKGTLFLDEIGDMSLSAQSKILRVLQEGELQRVGSNIVQKVDTRIIAATHKNLEDMIKKGTFREDLFYRLNVVPIICPALRERKSDIPILADYFCKKFAFELNIPQKHLAKRALAILGDWSFPGNIRELKNLIERLYIFVDGTEISASDIEPMLSNTLPEKTNISAKECEKEDSFFDETTSFQAKKQEFEYLYIHKQLQKHNFHVSKTAKSLKIKQSNFSKKLKKLNIKY